MTVARKVGQSAVALVLVGAAAWGLSTLKSASSDIGPTRVTVLERGREATSGGVAPAAG